MNLYYAPLEGITTYTYRNTHAELFGECDAYYAPFIVPTDNEKLSMKSLRDIKPENMPVTLTSSNKSTCSLIDFDSAILESNVPTPEEIFGTDRYWL